MSAPSFDPGDTLVGVRWQRETGQPGQIALIGRSLGGRDLWWLKFSGTEAVDFAQCFLGDAVEALKEEMHVDGVVAEYERTNPAQDPVT